MQSSAPSRCLCRGSSASYACLKMEDRCAVTVLLLSYSVAGASQLIGLSATQCIIQCEFYLLQRDKLLKRQNPWHQQHTAVAAFTSVYQRGALAPAAVRLSSAALQHRRPHPGFQSMPTAAALVAGEVS